MIMSMLRQQLVGCINISVPFLLLYSLAPDYALSLGGIILYCFAVGAYLGYVTYAATKNQSKGLLFAPTGVYKQQFIDEIIDAGLILKKCWYAMLILMMLLP